MKEFFYILLVPSEQSESKMPKTREQKENLVKSFTERLTKASSVVFTNYQGLTMSQLGGIRNKLRELNSEFLVTKNNLLEIALKNAQISLADPQVLKGPIATLFSFADEIMPLKIITKSFKEYNLGELKGGFLNKQYLDSAKINQLSTLPTKDELRAKLTGTLGAPLYGVVGVIQANLRNLVYAIDQIKIQKGGE